MTYDLIKEFIIREYRLNGNTKIYDINMISQEFCINMDDTVLWIPFGDQLKRHLKLIELGI